MEVDRVIVDNRAKDNLIADLRAENYELRQRERAFLALNDRVSESDYRLHLVKESKANLAEEMRRTADSDRLCIESNERDNIELGRALTDKRDDIRRLEEELAHLKTVSNGESADIDRFRLDLDAKNGVNAALRDDLKRLEDNLHGERVNNTGLRAEFAKCQDVLKSRDLELHSKRDTLHSLEVKQDDLTKLLSSKDSEFVARSKKLDDLDKELCHLNVIYKDTCHVNDGLDNQLNGQLNDNDSLRRANIEESAKNDDAIAHLEASLRDKDAHLSILHKDIDGMRAALDRSQASKDDLSEQLCAMNKHVGCLNDQNDRLSAELTDITERDAQIRAALDRRHRIKDITLANQNQMRESLSHIADVRSRSPCRRKKTVVETHHYAS
eukprot:CAMPEP_0197000876 /NCGR_PEP_ID=MMETSP1380-20130617/5712_1 /TAXON_ID=5936 /ORGANISM="Euplotes crassus, Strain CT5" /LENGTH=383 /DNA_ID=CAMNT_0042418331 /DNA_START=26 /DNA_END=1177 /DNA_ORIENTATION=-